MASSVTCDHTLEDVDFLLRRNWFFDTQDILGLLWELPEDLYLEIIARRSNYAPRIRDLLEFRRLPRPIPVRDAGDNDVGQRLDAWMRAHKKTFVPPHRPRESVDDALDAIADKIETHRTNIEDLARLVNKTKKYVPPKQRANLPIDPMVRDAQLKLQDLENEYARTSDIVNAIQKTWSELQWLDALHRDVASKSIPSDTHADAPSSSV